MTRKLGSSQIQNIVDVKSEVAEIKKLVIELYSRPIIPEPLVMEVVLEVYV